MKVDHVEGPQRILWTLQSSEWGLGPNQVNIMMIVGANGNLNVCHGPCLILLNLKTFSSCYYVSLYFSLVPFLCWFLLFSNVLFFNIYTLVCLLLYCILWDSYVTTL